MRYSDKTSRNGSVKPKEKYRTWTGGEKQIFLKKYFLMISAIVQLTRGEFQSSGAQTEKPTQSPLVRNTRFMANIV